MAALSLAATATLGSRSVYAATLTLFYGQDPSYANSNNSVMVSTNYNPNAGAPNASASPQYFQNPTLLAVSQNVPTTITLPVGGYLSLAIDAVLTGNSNPDGGNNTGIGGPATHQIQPSFLGLSSLSVAVSSTDTQANFLTPISNDNPKTPLSHSNGHNTYFSTAAINNTSSDAAGITGSAQGANGGSYNVIPNWTLAYPADVQPNAYNYDPGYGNGNVGLNGFTTGANEPDFATSSITGIHKLEQFAASNNVASYNNSTDFFDSLVYRGVSSGIVTLSPYAVALASGYWSLQYPGSSTAKSVYQTNVFGSTGDIINQLPSLVIDVEKQHQPIVRLEPTNDPNYGTTITSGTADHQGTFSPTDPSNLRLIGPANGGYTLAQVTGIDSNNGDSKGSVGVETWNLIYGNEIYGVDVMVNGTQATQAQLQTLLTAINGADGSLNSYVVAILIDPTADQVLTSLDTATTTYNLFLTLPYNYPGFHYLCLDMSNFNDPNLVGYTFSAISVVVPEPGSLIMLGGAALFLVTGRPGNRNRYRRVAPLSKRRHHL